MKKVVLASVLPLILYSNQFETTLQKQIDWLEEETFVVSASKSKENIKKAAASISVIEAEQIERMGANSLTDVLNTIPGLGVTQSNLFLKEIEARGIKDWFSKQVLFLVDGHPLDANFINGGATWSFTDMHLHNVKRIEVIKGPASSLYGANAFTALINIITKSASDVDGLETVLKTGSYNTNEANILYGKKYKDFSLVANLNVFDTNGNDHKVNVDASGNSGNINPYGKRIKADLKLDINNFYFTSSIFKREDGPHYGAASNINDETLTKNNYLYSELGYTNSYFDDLNLKSKVYYDRYSFDNTWEIDDSRKMINRVVNTKLGVDFLANYDLTNDYKLTFGSMFEEHKQFDTETIQNFDPSNNNLYPGGMKNLTNTSDNFAPDVKREMWAFYLNNLYDITSNIRLTYGTRYDHYSDFGSNLSFRGGVSYLVNENNSLKFMYGEGFRAPTFAELYNKNNVLNGNDTLSPETVQTYEVSLNSALSSRFDSQITLFRNDFEDLIVFQSSSSEYVNRGKT